MVSPAVWPGSDYKDLIINEKQAGNNKSPTGIANSDFLAQISDTWTASTDSLISYKIVYHGQLHPNYSVDFFFIRSLEGLAGAAGGIHFILYGEIFFTLSFGEISSSMMRKV